MQDFLPFNYTYAIDLLIECNKSVIKCANMFEPSFCSVLTSILLFKLKGEIRAYGYLKLKYIFCQKEKNAVNQRFKSNVSDLFSC